MRDPYLAMSHAELDMIEIARRTEIEEEKRKSQQSAEATDSISKNNQGSAHPTS